MNTGRSNSTDPVVVARAVDSLCDRYEAALRGGEAGRLEAWLPADGPTRAMALIELAAVELEHRLRAGEPTQAEEYFVRYPELRTESAAARLAVIERRWRRDAPAGLPETTAAGGPGAARLAAASVFGRYRIVKVIGQGGMGTVYHAHDTQLDRPVALKVIRFGRDDPALVERFFREARLAASFTHPHLCPVYDFAREGDVHYLTMPLLGGEPLSAHLRREGRMPAAAAVRLTALVARAVQEAHRAGVIHRDLKPANVMLNERREPVVMDFGLARRVGPLDPRTTTPGTLVGTPAYMAPEQIGGDPGGPAQDVYALGVMLYEMLTGALPFEGSLQEMLKGALSRDPEPPSRRRPDLDPRLDRICLTAMARDPRARFPSMEAFAEALDACIGQAAPPRRRRWTPWLVGGSAAAVLVVLAAAWWVWRPTLPPASSGPPTPPAVVSDHPKADGFQAGDAWDGTFHWVGDDYLRSLHVNVTERSGDHFRGIYADEKGEYVWKIEGTVHDDAVEWRFTQIVHEEEARPEVLKSARVTGKVDGRRLEASYRDENSTAILSLRSSK